MSIINVKHIQAAIEKRFRNLVNLSDVKGSSAQEDCFLTRGLSAFVVAELSGASDAIAASSVVDCFGDNGIDALYFNAPERVCYLVQSKWIKSGNGSVDVASALKFTQGVHDFFQGDLDGFAQNMRDRRSLIDEILADSRNTFKLVIAYTGQQPLASEVQRPLDKLLAALNDTSDLVELRVLRQAELHAIVARGARGETVNLQILLKEWGTVREPYQAYYGQVDLKDIATWGQFGTNLTAKNIRGFKGSTDVNEGLLNTIRTNPQNFWYFNNGITLVSDKVTPQPLGSGTQNSRVFQCEGASVVNGAQTVGSIVSFVNSGGNGLQDARVLVRIISLEGCPPNFGAEITKAANTQNRVENKDFVAQDLQQARLQTELFLENSKRYTYRSGDVNPTIEEGFAFEDAAVALACAHPDITYCVQAKREVGKLWDDITKPPYTILFNIGTNALRMWRSVEIMRSVEAELKVYQSANEGKPKLIATHGNRFLLYILFHSALDPEEDNLDITRKAVPKAVAATLERLIVSTMKLYKDSYPSNLFKNLTKCKELAAEMAVLAQPAKKVK